MDGAAYQQGLDSLIAGCYVRRPMCLDSNMKIFTLTMIKLQFREKGQMDILICAYHYQQLSQNHIITM